jgi:hypothetical protein
VRQKLRRRARLTGSAIALICDSSSGNFVCNNARNEREATMRASQSAAIIAALVIVSSTAWSACLSGKSRNCINLDLVPQISQRIVGGEHITAPRATVPAAEPTSAYTGPTVGVAPTVRGAPTVGYRWAIN